MLAHIIGCVIGTRDRNGSVLKKNGSVLKKNGCESQPGCESIRSSLLTHGSGRQKEDHVEPLVAFCNCPRSGIRIVTFRQSSYLDKAMHMRSHAMHNRLEHSSSFQHQSRAPLLRAWKSSRHAVTCAAGEEKAVSSVKTLKEWSVVIGALGEGEQTVTGAWTTKDPAAIIALSPLHIGTDKFMEAKLKWRGVQPLTILELRTFRLKAPVSVPVEDSLFGCFSWLDLQVGEQVALEGAVACVSDDEFEQRQQLLRQQLGTFSVEELTI
eukprot:gene3541-13610_t